MSRASLCRLCINICSDYVVLEDEKGRTNMAYEVTVKYFDPMFLNVDQGDRLTVMCLECWRHISDFHNFRQSVLLAQANLHEDDKLAVVVLESHAEIKKEKCSKPASGVMEEDQFNSEPEREFVGLPSSERSNGNCTTESFNDDVEISSTQVNEYPEQECNNNIFLADGAELISLIKSVPKIEFTEYCMTTTEPISQRLIKDNPSPIASNRDNNVENISSIDGTDNLSQDYEDPQSSCTEPMDISEYELESKLKGASEGPKLKVTKEIVATYGAGISQYGEQTECTPKRPSVERKRAEATFSVATQSLANISQDNVAPKDVSEQHLIKKTQEVELDDLIAQWKPILECVTCSETFRRYTLLHDHFLQQHGKKGFYIACCRLKFERRGRLAEHILLHMDPNTFKCVICSKPYKEETKLRHHMIRQHGVNIFNDNYQGDSSPLTDNGNISKNCNALLKYSKNVYENQGQGKLTTEESDDLIAQWKANLKCLVCHETYSSYSLLWHHFRQEHREKDFYILCCQIQFKQRQQLVDHVCLHLDPNAFKCEHCSNRYTRKHSLQSHMITKHGVNSNKTDISQGDCGQEPTSKSPPIGNKFKCEVCNKLFPFKSSLRRHWRKVHHAENNNALTPRESDVLIAQWKPNLECVNCSEIFPSYTLLRIHFSQVHRNEEFYILCCEAMFKQRVLFADHVQLHLDSNAFKCEFCGQRYKRNIKLRYHMLTQHGVISNKNY